MKTKFLLLFLLTFPLVASTQTIYIKLNPIDCSTCTSAVHDIQKIGSFQFVMKEEFRSDSADIVERFNFYKFKPSFVWSDSLYNYLSKTVLSEVLVVESGKIVFRTNLKNGNLNEMPKYVNSLENLTVALPSSFNLRTMKVSLLLQNYVTSKYTYVNVKNNKAYSLNYTDSAVEHVYTSLLKDSLSYKCYLQQKEDLFKPVTSAAEIVNDSISRVMLRNYIIEKINGHDTFIGKSLSVMELVNGNLVDVKLLVLKSMPLNYGVDEGEMISYGNNLFLLSKYYGNEKEKNSNYKYLTKFKLSNNAYVFDTLYNFVYHESLFKHDLYNSYARYISADGYVTQTISNYIIDLSTMGKIKIPIADSLFDLNKDALQNVSLRFGIVDIKYKEPTNDFVILYRVDKNYFVAKFKKGAQQFAFNEVKFDAASLKDDRLRAICLAADGNGLIYSVKNNDRLKTISLD